MKVMVGNTISARRILVVDDNEFSAKTLTWAMEMYGYEVEACLSGSAALAVARDYRPDVVLLDIGMPVMNGYDVCRKLRENPETALACVVAQTGWGDEETKRRTQDAGLNYHFTKPIDSGAIHDLIERIAA